jgi:hypothetical protein
VQLGKNNSDNLWRIVNGHAAGQAMNTIGRTSARRWRDW